MDARMPMHRRQRGLSLIELMVAMTLGLMLMASCLALHYSTRAGFGSLEQTTTLQQNARFALAELNRDIRMAGAFGCAASAPVNNPVNGGSPFYRYDSTTNGVALFDGIASLGAVFSATDQMASGSPILEVQYGRGGGVITGGNASSTITQLTVQLPGTQGFDASAPVLALASCGRVDIVAQGLSPADPATRSYTLANLPALPNNAATAPASGTHDGTIEAFQLVTRFYYVKNSSGSQGLYVKTLNGAGALADIPVAEQVSAMSVELGAISQAPGSAPTVQYGAGCGGAFACNKVGLVRVGLTLAANGAPQAGSASAPVSQRYITTIALRNHGVLPP